jgi:hydrogenase assembly chaperone HypC/HupF
MCYSLPGQVIRVAEEAAVVSLGAAYCEVGRRLVAELKIGDWVLVNAGQIIRRLSPEEVEATQEALKAIMAIILEGETDPESEARSEPEPEAREPAQLEIEAARSA